MLSAEKVLILASDNFVVWTGEIEAEKIMLFVLLILVICTQLFFCFLFFNHYARVKKQQRQNKRKKDTDQTQTLSELFRAPEASSSYCGLERGIRKVLQK